ncbi:hypothetical protein SCWH03_27980 [Streptomyces pacificus]|uniref:Aromatic ring-opening dioxygenase LigA n=2 Tax=Streptomyces pacificus TaxID=2705029 RepID=A0A6A0AV64_9ACTN|nr:hypothetical protein SCWH03_27980 [Streptomyces pacificus]
MVPAVVAAVGAAALSTAPAAQAAEEPNPNSYRFGVGARSVEGAESSADAEALEAGTTYHSSIGPGGKLNFRVDLDAERNAYVSVVAVPRPGTELAYSDGIEVTLQDAQGTRCSSADEKAGAGRFARPLAAAAHRTIGGGRSTCQEAGAYNVLVERAEAGNPAPADASASASASASAPASASVPAFASGTWELEIRHVTEPGLRQPGPTEAPTAWPSASPGLPGGEARETAGGTGFNDAAEISEGEWSSRMEAGRTYFYRVGVDWGQRIFATASLGSTNTEDFTFVSEALTMRLYNPVRALVEYDGTGPYDGRQKQASLDPLPEVAYENRFAGADKVQGMRLRGDYYLAVSLNPRLAEKFGKERFGVTLRVNVEGDAEAAPPYAEPVGDLGVFESEKVERSDTMRLVGLVGVGTGALLVVGLGAWTLLARRAVAAPARGVPAQGVPAQGVPPADAGAGHGVPLPGTPAPARGPAAGPAGPRPTGGGAPYGDTHGCGPAGGPGHEGGTGQAGEAPPTGYGPPPSP